MHIALCVVSSDVESDVCPEWRCCDLRASVVFGARLMRRSVHL